MSHSIFSASPTCMSVLYHGYPHHMSKCLCAAHDCHLPMHASKLAAEQCSLTCIAMLVCLSGVVKYARPSSETLVGTAWMRSCCEMSFKICFCTCRMTSKGSCSLCSAKMAGACSSERPSRKGRLLGPALACVADLHAEFRQRQPQRWTQLSTSCSGEQLHCSAIFVFQSML